MTLLPSRFQINDELPSIGKLVREETRPKPCKFREFEKKSDFNDHYPLRPGLGALVRENDCRQIKGAAQVGKAEKVAGTRPVPVAAPPLTLKLNLSGSIGQWKDCSKDMPDLPAGRYFIRNICTGHEELGKLYPLKQNIGGAFKFYQYREIHE